MKIKIIISFFLVISLIALNNISFAEIINKTGFYLNTTDGSSVEIPPNAVIPESYTGGDGCATSTFDTNLGCEELDTSKSGLTQGGYSTWFGINHINNTCSIAPFIPYQCKFDAKNGLSLDYKSIQQAYTGGPHVGQPVELGPVSTYTTGPTFRGVNVSGLEYDGTFLDALFQHPDIPDVQYFAQQGMNTIRLPIRWEFLIGTQGNLIESKNPDPNAQNVTANNFYLEAVFDTVQKYLKSGLTVDVDMHNYMRFCSEGAKVGQSNEPTDPVNDNCKLVTGDQLAAIWKTLLTTPVVLKDPNHPSSFAQLAQQYPKQLIFELMNEPFTIPNQAGQQLTADDLLVDEVSAVKAIRSLGVNNLILLSGDYWDPLHGWTTGTISPPDKPNGEVFTAANLKAAGITDMSNIALDMHQYFDDNWSGTHEQCQPLTSYDDFKHKLSLVDDAGSDILGNWIKANNMKVFLGEFGASSDADCITDLKYMLQYVNEHAYDAAHPEAGGFIGWTAWRANRHGGPQAFSPFNFLQQEDNTVYGADGSPGTGIVQGGGNSLMQSVFSQYLTPPTL